MTLLLASKSATRRAMLAAAGVPFAAVDAPFDEEAAKADIMTSGADPRSLAARLAAAKAESVAAGADDFVLGADQVLETADGGVLSKARSREEMAAQLRTLSGRTHYLHAAAAVVRDGSLRWSALETAALSMRPLGDAFIHAYLDAEFDAVRWNVGGYRIEGPGAQLFTAVEGSHFAILGLPLLPLLAFLRREAMLAT